MSLRPEPGVLKQFYALADFDERARLDAAVNLANQVDGGYCVERLVGGLSSSRACARLGYATALTELLRSTTGDEWSCERLWKLADFRLNLDSPDPSASAVGRLLLCTAMIASERYSQDAASLAVHLLDLLPRFPFLGMAISRSLSTLCHSLDRELFTRHLWPVIERHLAVPLAEITPHFFYLLLSIRHFVPKWFGQPIPTEKSLSAEDYPHVVELLKKLDPCAVSAFTIELFQFARDTRTFADVHANAIEKWAFHGNDHHKAYERGFQIAQLLLSREDITGDEIDVIISKTLLTHLRIATRGGKAESRFLYELCANVMTLIEERVAAVQLTREQMLGLIERLEDVEPVLARVGDQLCVKLDDKGCRKLLARLCETTSPSSFRRIGRAFRDWSLRSQERCLLQLATVGHKEAGSVFAACITSLLKVFVRAGKVVTATLDPQVEEMLRRTLKKLAKESIEEIVDQGLPLQRPISLLILLLQLLGTVSEKPESSQYTRDVAEALTCLQSTGNTTVLLDLLLSILSRPQRYLRSIVHFIFVHMLPWMKSRHVRHMFQSINQSDEEMLGIGDVDDEEEFEAINEENADQVNGDESPAVEDANEEMSDEESDADCAPVDPELLFSLKEALGPAATHSDTEESAASDVSDETMLRLDSRLADAFRAHRDARGKSRTDLLEEGSRFRARCFDLLLIVVSHQGSTSRLILGMLVPLVETAQEALRRKGGDFVFQRSTDLLQIICKGKKPEVSAEKASETLIELATATATVTNPALKASIADVACFLFRLGFDADGKANEAMANCIERLLREYMEGRSRMLGEIVIAPLMRSPGALTPQLATQLIDFAFRGETLVFRRTEALTCLVALLRPNAIPNDRTDKFWRRLGRRLAPLAQHYLATIVPDSSVKPRFFAQVIRLLEAFAVLAPATTKNALGTHLTEVLERLQDDQLWTKSELKKCQSEMAKTFNGLRGPQVIARVAAKLGTSTSVEQSRLSPEATGVDQ